MRALALTLLLGGCTPVSYLFGEVHLHEYADGLHPAALFVEHPLLAADASGESIFTIDAPLPGTCRADGPPSSVPDFTEVDDGTLTVSGGKFSVTLDWSKDLHGYVPPAPLPIGQPLFTGGEELLIETSGAAAPALAGGLVAPRPLSLTAPVSLDVLASDLEIRWPPSDASRVLIILVGSTMSDEWSSITCSGIDSDGALTIPASLIASLPAAPRDLQLQVSRDQLLRVPSSDNGYGIVFHAGYQLTLTGHQN